MLCSNDRPIHDGRRIDPVLSISTDDETDALWINGQYALSEADLACRDRSQNMIAEQTAVP